VSGREYPRWSWSTRLKPNTTKMCAIHDCDQPAEWSVCLEVSWFRGEDVTANFCKAHRDRGMRDPAGMLVSTHEGAWK